MEPSLVTRLIRLGRPPVSPRGLRSAEREVSPLDRWLGLDRDQVVRELADCCGRGHPTTTGEVSPGELADARDLAERKYATAEWIDRIR
jgi:lipoate-protein ligase A